MTGRAEQDVAHRAGPVAEDGELLAERGLLRDLECHTGAGEPIGRAPERFVAWVVGEVGGHGSAQASSKSSWATPPPSITAPLDTSGRWFTHW